MSKAKAIPKALRDYAIARRLNVGRAFDSSGKHAYYYLTVGGKQEGIRQSASGMLAYLRQHYSGKPKANPGRVSKRTAARRVKRAVSKRASTLAAKERKLAGMVRELEAAPHTKDMSDLIAAMGDLSVEIAEYKRAPKKGQKRNPARQALRNESAARLARAALAAAYSAKRSKNTRLLQARVSYAQGIIEALHKVSILTAQQARAYLSGLRDLIK